jgi:pyruvate,water dikinase
MATRQNDFIRWFDEISIADVPLVGGKNASLGELYRELGKAGVRVPNGFAVTAEGYRFFVVSLAWTAAKRSTRART